MHSLASRHPWRFDVPLLLAVSLVLLVQGLTMPAMEITAFIIWRDEYTILQNIEHLYRAGRRPAAIVLALGSVAYPAAKILILFLMWLAPFPAGWRSRLVHLLRLLGRWSMLDVLAVAAIVVGSRVIFLVAARPLAGLYFYAAGILLLTVATLGMDRLARHGRA